jgi:hypothetical protein
MAARPAVPVWLEGIEVAAQTGLLDTGAMATRFAGELAEVAGIDLTESESQSLIIGGQEVSGQCARVNLRVSDGTENFSWDAPVWFCDPWPWGFQLLGLRGFLDYFVVTISAYDEWVELQPRR